MHNSFAITWGILGVMILVLLPITDYLNIPKKTLYNIPIGGFYFEMNMHMLRSNYKLQSYLDEHDMSML